MLFNVGIKLGVSPRLISERLLSDLDKNDMLAGKISIVELEAFTEVWRDNGMPDYVHGLTESLRGENNKPKLANVYKKNDSSLAYNKPFIDYRVQDES